MATAKAPKREPEKGQEPQAKPPLADRITSVLTGGRISATMTAAQRKALRDQATARAELLLARCERSRKGSTEYSPESIKRFKYELNAIQSGTWTGPGMKMPGQAKKNEPSYYAVNAQGYAPEEAKAESRVDAIISSDG